jgi:hypothetical protein
MQVHASGHLRLDLAQEVEELLVGVARMHWAITCPVLMSRAAKSVVVPWRK